jgi:hypothetical protein
VSALPGVRSVSFLDSVPLSIGGTGYDFKTQGGKGGEVRNLNADVYNVGSRLFETLGIPLLRGRDFSRQTGDEHAVIINQTAARGGTARHRFARSPRSARRANNGTAL